MKKIITFALLLIFLCFVTQGFSQTDTTSTKNFDWEGYMIDNPPSGEIIHCENTETQVNKPPVDTRSSLPVRLHLFNIEFELTLSKNDGTIFYTDTIQGTINRWIPIEDPSIDECTVTIKDLEWELETSWKWKKDKKNKWTQKH